MKTVSTGRSGGGTSHSGRAASVGTGWMFIERADRVVDFIRAYIRMHGYAPTVREIMDGVGLASTAAVQYHLEKLRDSGVITWIPGRARTIRVLEEG